MITMVVIPLMKPRPMQNVAFLNRRKFRYYKRHYKDEIEGPVGEVYGWGDGYTVEEAYRRALRCVRTEMLPYGANIAVMKRNVRGHSFLMHLPFIRKRSFSYTVRAELYKMEDGLFENLRSGSSDLSFN